MDNTNRTAHHAAKGSRSIGSTSPVRTAVYRAQLAAQADADRWMSEAPRAQWSETLVPGAIGVDGALLAKLCANESDAEETATAYAETFRATVREALSTTHRARAAQETTTTPRPVTGPDGNSPISDEQILDTLRAIRGPLAAGTSFPWEETCEIALGRMPGDRAAARRQFVHAYNARTKRTP